jgi:hypothetical protein
MSPTLSYFTTSDIEVGSIVSVPIRSKNIHAIVSEVRPAEEARSEIRNAPFEIRKNGRFVTSVEMVSINY